MINGWLAAGLPDYSIGYVSRPVTASVYVIARLFGSRGKRRRFLVKTNVTGSI
ncbi:hypothetical protein [Brenneria goodwinii]|uniref:hypothetical protein n=1 Tax=Brenneria goodwinii TaxID=1109412 RepID=UPI0036F3E513